jgi:phosphoesterase, MJ0936 family
MKILVVSDTHRQHRALEEVLLRVGAIDAMIHLGDAEGREDYIEALLDCPLHIIKGNNDVFVRIPSEEEFYLGKYKVFICHGHQYGVGRGVNKIKEEAKKRQADIAMFGHTHIPFLQIEEEVTLLNPGSISYPRQSNRQGSFAIIEIDGEGKVHYTINYV